MTTPGASRRSSEEINGVSSSTMQQSNRCCCRADTISNLPIRHSSPDINLGRAAYNVAGQFPRLPVHDLLNSASPNGNQYPNEVRTLGINNASASINERGQARTISSSSAMSISSASTLQPPFSIAEERVFLVGELYRTCRNASSDHRRLLPPINRHTHRRTRISCPRNRHRLHPYDQTSRPEQKARQRSVGRPQSLMDNIAAICTHMWRRARSHALAPHRAEAEAVRAMRDLYDWGELITRGFQSDDFDDMIIDYGSAMGSLSSTDGNDIWLRVGEAAKNLCEWFDNDEAVAICEGITNELRELKENEEGESSDGFGGIL
jgi:hypothetical protein